MRYGFINNFGQALAADITSTATTMTLDGGGSEMADASTDYRYKLTLVQTDAFGNETHREIVDVTGASGNTLTVVREQEGTTALAWASGTKVYGRVTAGHLVDMQPPVLAAPPVSIALGPLDFADGTSSATWEAPAGVKMFVDSVEVVPFQDADTGWEVLGIPFFSSRSNFGHNTWGVAFSPDGTLLAVAEQNSPYVSIISTSDWTVITTLETDVGAGTRDVHFSHNGNLLAVGGSNAPPTLHVFNTADWTLVAGTPVIPGTIYALEFSADDAYLAVAGDTSDSSSNLSIIDTLDWSIVSDTPIVAGRLVDVSWRPDGAQLAVVGWQTPYLHVFETATWTEVAGQTLQGDGMSCAFNPAGTYLAVSIWSSPDWLRVYNVSDYSVANDPTLPTGADGVPRVRWQPETGHLAASHHTGGLLSMYDPSDWSPVDAPEFSITGSGMAFNPSGDALAIAAPQSPWAQVAKTLGGTPLLDLGVSSASPTSLLAGQEVAFSAYDRVTSTLNAVGGVESLYVSVGTAASSAGDAMVIVRGYTLES